MLFIVVWCPGKDMRPYSCPKTMARGDKTRYHFIREGAITAIPSDDELKDLFAPANKTPFDDRVNHRATLSDVNYALVKSYLSETGSNLSDIADGMPLRDLLMNMNLISDLPEYEHPKNVALMFFNAEPHRFFPYA